MSKSGFFSAAQVTSIILGLLGAIAGLVGVRSSGEAVARAAVVEESQARYVSTAAFRAVVDSLNLRVARAEAACRREARKARRRAALTPAEEAEVRELLGPPEPAKRRGVLGRLFGWLGA